VLFYVFFVSILVFYFLFVCKCVLYYCHRVSTQLQLNVYHIISYIQSYHIISKHTISYIIYNIIKLQAYLFIQSRSLMLLQEKIYEMLNNNLP